MSRHTLGPWVIATSCSWRRVLSESGAHVCIPCIQQHDGHPDLYFPNGGEDGPDARLIAAAPELLEALLNASGVLQAFATQSQTAALCEEMARAAIAKATGPAP